MGTNQQESAAATESHKDSLEELVNAAAEEAAQEVTGRKRRRWPMVVAGVALVLGGAYVGLAYYFADKIPANTRVAGVKVGGMSRAQAGDVLSDELGTRLSSPVEVTIGTTSAQVNPADYEATFNEDKTLDSLVGFSVNPARMWDHITGGSDVAPVIDVDDAKLNTVIDGLAENDVEPVDATLAFEGTNTVTTQAVVGHVLDRDGTRKALTQSILAKQPIKLPVVEAKPDISDEEVDDAVTRLAEPLVSGDLAVNVNSTLVTLTPEQLASAARFVGQDGELRLTMDPKALGDIVREGAPGELKPGKEATVEIVDHTTPRIVPSEDGIGIDDDELAAKVAEAGVTKDRTVDIATTAVPAEFTTEDAEKLGVKEVVSSIETPLTDDSVRTTNLIVGSQKINGTIIQPGEEFSLIEALGPIDEAHGFVSSGVVANGFNSTALGGGLSQLSTNTFNLGYLAGFEDIEHQPHSKYFERYPMGREATLWTGQIDMRFKNNTPYAAVIDTWVADGKLHSQLWSTKYYDVETHTSDPYAYTQGTTKNNPAWDCEPSSYTSPGFTVTVYRKVTLDGKVVEDSSYNWTYKPVDAVTCN